MSSNDEISLSAIAVWFLYAFLKQNNVTGNACMSCISATSSLTKTVFAGAYSRIISGSTVCFSLDVCTASMNVRMPSTSRICSVNRDCFFVRITTGCCATLIFLSALATPLFSCTCFQIGTSLSNALRCATSRSTVPVVSILKMPSATNPFLRSARSCCAVSTGRLCFTSTLLKASRSTALFVIKVSSKSKTYNVLSNIVVNPARAGDRLALLDFFDFRKVYIDFLEASHDCRVV